jgi:hypothetical protein
MGEVTVDPVPQGGPAGDQIFPEGDQATHSTPPGRGLVSQRQAAVEILTLDAGGVGLVRLVSPGLGGLRHLHDIGQLEFHAISQQIFDAGPAGGALLDPDHTAAAGGPAGLIDEVAQCLCAGRHLGENHLLSGARIEPADHADTVMIINAQDDTLLHGGLR